MVRSRLAPAAVSLLLLGSLPRPALATAAGARSFKSGPIQITRDGSTVWVANPHSDSVTRIDAATLVATEIPLPADPGGPHDPLGLSVSEDGSEVWVACHDSDRVYVLAGTGPSTGSVLARIDLPWGSGAYSVALSRPDASLRQRFALVTLNRAEGLAVIDTASRTVSRLLQPVFWTPLGIAWMEDGVSAWVTHPLADIEGPYLTRVDFTDPAVPKVTTRIHVLSSNPLASGAVTNPPAEGGYLMQRGHLAQIPTASGRSEVWLPTQYSSIHDDVWSPDSAFQSVMRHLDLPTRTLPNTNLDKVVLTAVNVHDPTSPGGTVYSGPGWSSPVAGPIDIAFTQDGQTAYVVHEISDDVLVVPASTPAVKPSASPALVRIGVGSRPTGIAVSPVPSLGFVSNELDGTVSVVDLALGTVAHPPIAVTAPPFGGGPVLRGAQLFHTSQDPRISAGGKGACASCHPRAETDGRPWSLQLLPDGGGNKPSAHGPRPTMSLLGTGRTFTPGEIDGATGWGQLHRSGDRDEVQDFDHTFQSVILGGQGFLGAAQCPEVFPPSPGCSNAGKDADLDALAAYVEQLEVPRRSPHRAASGALSEAAIRGATFFFGTGTTRPADAGCAGCHVPETGWVDHAFHDVGSYHDMNENELNKRTPMWAANTQTLLGVWATPTYDGAARFLPSLLELMKDYALAAPQRTVPHGRLQGLTRRQIVDLSEFVGSIDGDLTAPEARAARDTTPPRVVRAEPISLTRVSVWLSESVDPAEAGDPARWAIVKQGGGAMPVSAATFDRQNGDRVTLTTQLQQGCSPVTYTVLPVGVIEDLADSASGGTRNPIDLADASNRIDFVIGDTLTVTLGGSGYEDLTVPVHDVSVLDGAGVIGGDSIWLDKGKGRHGFVRFDWKALFQASTGVASASDLLDASFTLTGSFGDAQPLELRRVLQPWSDVAVTDSDFNTPGRCTSTHHVYPTATWNQPGAAALGGSGGVPSDYNGAFDLAATIDLSLTPPTINLPTVFGGPQVLDAFRFWFNNPGLDYGYHLALAAGTRNELKFSKSEDRFGELGPVLTITYALPAVTPTVPAEVSGPGAEPLTAVKEGTGVHLHFQDLALGATSYNVYEGAIGTWYSHSGAACNVDPGTAAPGRDLALSPQAGSRYFQVTASDSCSEGPPTSTYPPGLDDCLP